MKQGLVIACMFISCSVLAPILWHLWIVMGTANSNFYFGVTLAYNTAQVSNEKTNSFQNNNHFIVYSDFLNN